MKAQFSILAVLIFATSSIAQKVDGNSYSVLAHASSDISTTKTWPHFLISDRQWSYRARSPMLMSLPATPARQGDSYWLSTMTSQSYNGGKLGTFYYWDVNGNLCESRTYVDIAGKNKRGLKLVFRRK